MAITLPPFTTSASISGSTVIAQADEQLNTFMNDAKSYMTTSFNSASSQLVTEVTNSIVANSVTATKSSAAFNTTAGTWYRIATSPVDINRNSGVFVLDWYNYSVGHHGVVRLSAGCHYGSSVGVSIQQLELTSYAASLFSEARIVYHTTFTGNYAYLEVKASAASTNVLVNVELQDALGWSLISPSTLGSIPSGYTSYTHTFVNIANTTAGTFPKVTFNKEGRVTAGSALVEADVPALNASKITAGTLPVARGGTGVSTSTGTGSVVLSTSPTLVTPNIGNATGNLTGTASLATNLTGGVLGNIHYQSAANTTATLANGTSGQVLKSNGNAAPSWSTLDMTMLPDEAFKKRVACVLNNVQSLSTATTSVLTGYSSTATVNCTTTAGSTTITGNVTNNIKVGAVVSTATQQLAAGTTVASIVNATSFTVTNRANITTTDITGSGTEATATFAAQTYAPYAVGSTITIAGASPTTYNGTFTVTACTTTVKWASVETATATVQGTISFSIKAGASPTTFAQTISTGSTDGVTFTVGMRVLVIGTQIVGGLTNAANEKYNGIYEVTAVGSASVPWVLTRTTDADTSAKIAGSIVTATQGTTYGGKIFTNKFKSTDTLGTTSMPWEYLKPTDYIATAGATTIGTVAYNGTTSATGKFDGGATNPTGTTRLNYSGYLYPTALNMTGQADTTTASSHVFVETGSDGFVRPKTLANFKTEMFTSPTLVTPNIGVATGTSFNSITGLASVAPLAAGTATVGTSTLTARQDHVHPAQTTITGNAGTATKLATARTITLTGDVTGSVSFDGTTNVSITSTVQDNSHNHTVLTSVNNIGFNLANATAPTAGQLVWNSAEETLDLGLDDEVTLQIGQELLVRGKNTTGATIPNGRVLMATGAVGNSGVITIGLHNGVQATGFKIAGISTEDISNNEVGFSLLRGKLRGINCTGSQFGEVWNVGDGLWVSPNGGGAMTNVEPSVDQLKMFIGVVINNTANGTIQVRTNGIDENHYVEYVGTIEEFEGALI